MLLTSNVENSYKTVRVSERKERIMASQYGPNMLGCPQFTMVNTMSQKKLTTFFQVWKNEVIFKVNPSKDRLLKLIDVNREYVVMVLS